MSLSLRWPAPLVEAPLPARLPLHSSLDVLQFVPADDAERDQGIVSRFDRADPKLFGGNIVSAELHEDSINDYLRFRNDLIGSEKPDATRDGVKRDGPFKLRVVIVNVVSGGRDIKFGRLVYELGIGGLSPGDFPLQEVSPMPASFAYPGAGQRRKTSDESAHDGRQSADYSAVHTPTSRPFI